MGILKHLILPGLAVVHAFQAFKILTDGKGSIPAYYGWPDSSDSLTDREAHLMGVVLSISLALSLNCLAAVLFENSHYRGMATVLEFVFFTSQAYDAHQTGYPTTVKLAFALLSAGGLAVHAMEPGIFTKDKTKAKGN